MRSPLSLAGAAALAALSAAPLAAQTATAPRADTRADARAESRARTLVYRSDDADDRPVIGVSTTSSGDRDTLGLLVVGVTAGGPADRAGIAEGDRLAAVNGVNLRLAAADAGESDMGGLTTRRLSREIAKAKPGTDVELRVWSGGAYKTVKVKTVAASELPGRDVRFTRNDMDARGVVGLTLGSGGSRRDTLGVLVARVETDGPAEKAGLVEGDRIVSVNGTDLRVAKEDAGDPWVSSAKTSRFTRALRDLKPGEKVTLRVWSGGQTKTVDVTAGKASDVYHNTMGSVFMNGGDVMQGFAPMIAPIPPMAPMGPMPPMAPARVRIMNAGPETFNFEIGGDAAGAFDSGALRALDGQVRVQVERALEGAARARAAAPRGLTIRRGATTI